MRVEVGRSLRELNPPYRTWEIVRIIRPIHGRRHAQLRLSTDPKTVRLLSCRDIERGADFRPVEMAALD